MIPSVVGALFAGETKQETEVVVNSTTTVSIPVWALEIDVYTVGGGQAGETAIGGSVGGAGGRGGCCAYARKQAVDFAGYSGIYCSIGDGGIGNKGSGGTTIAYFGTLSGPLICRATGGAPQTSGGTGDGVFNGGTFGSNGFTSPFAGGGGGGAASETMDGYGGQGGDSGSYGGQPGNSTVFPQDLSGGSRGANLIGAGGAGNQFGSSGYPGQPWGGGGGGGSGQSSDQPGGVGGKGGVLIRFRSFNSSNPAGGGGGGGG